MSYNGRSVGWGAKQSLGTILALSLCGPRRVSKLLWASVSLALTGGLCLPCRVAERVGDPVWRRSAGCTNKGQHCEGPGPSEQGHTSNSFPTHSPTVWPWLVPIKNWIYFPSSWIWLAWRLPCTQQGMAPMMLPDLPGEVRKPHSILWFSWNAPGPWPSWTPPLWTQLLCHEEPKPHGELRVGVLVNNPNWAHSELIPAQVASMQLKASPGDSTQSCGSPQSLDASQLRSHMWLLIHQIMSGIKWQLVHIPQFGWF